MVGAEERVTVVRPYGATIRARVFAALRQAGLRIVVPYLVATYGATSFAMREERDAAD